MAQDRFWNFKDDDSTARMIQKDTAMYPSGRYHGFIPTLGAGMTLTLAHTSDGFERTNSLPAALESNLGAWVSRQGTLITESASINIVVSVGHATLPRYDAIFGSHNYAAIIGGSTALYTIVQGTPSATPAIPASPSVIHTLLGWVYVPPLTNDLNDAGVVYTPAPVPSFANDTTIAHTDREQTFTEIQNIHQQKSEWSFAYLENTSPFVYSINREKNVNGTTKTTELITDNIIVDSTSLFPTPAQYYIVDAILPLPTTNGQRLNIYFKKNVVIANTFVEQGSGFMEEGKIYSFISVPNEISGIGYAWFALPTIDRAAYIKLQGLLALSVGQILEIDLAYKLDLGALSGRGNIQVISTDDTGALRHIKSNFSTPFVDVVNPAEALFFIRWTGVNQLVIENESPAPPSGYKSIRTPNALSYSPRYNNGYFILIEEDDYYRIVDTNILEDVNTAWTPLVVGGNWLQVRPVFFRIEANIVRFKGEIEVTATSGANAVFNIPAEARPAVDITIPLNTYNGLNVSNIIMVEAPSLAGAFFRNGGAALSGDRIPLETLQWGRS